MDNPTKLLLRRKELGLTLEEVGRIVGVGKSTVRKWETGYIANMKRDKIARLAKALQVSPAYIMGLDESAIKTEKSLLSKREQQSIDRYMKLNDKNSIDTHIDLIYASEAHQEELSERTQFSTQVRETVSIFSGDLVGTAAAGAGVVNGDIGTDQITLHAAPEEHWDYLIKVTGDSMEPIFPDGQLLFVKRQNYIEHGQVGVFETENGHIVKKFVQLNNTIELHSFNRNYTPFTPKELRVEGKVITIH